MIGVDLTFLWSSWGMLLLHGFWMTIILASVCGIFAMLIGFCVGISRWSGNRLLAPICTSYIEVARNTPPLVQILFWYFSASFIFPRPVVLWLLDVGLPFAAAVIALSLYHGAFVAEVVRAGLNSVHVGQFEAARALGLRFIPMMRTVIMPQVMRITLPSLANELISLAKGTSLALAIGVAELSYQAKYIETYAFRGVEALMAATILYLILCLSIAGLGRLLSRWLPSPDGQEIQDH